MNIQKIKFRKTSFALKGGAKGGDHITLFVDSLNTNSQFEGKQFIISIYEDSNPELIAKFEAVIIKEEETDNYIFSEINRTDNFEHELPPPQTEDENGKPYLEPLIYQPPHFLLHFESKENKSFPIIITFSTDNDDFAIYSIRFLIELKEDGSIIFNSKGKQPLHYIDCNNIVTENCRKAVIFIIGNHYNNLLERGCGTHYGALYPYRFKDEEEYLKTANNSGFTRTAKKFKGTWDQNIKDNFDKDKQKYDLNITDCIDFVLDVLSLGFKKSNMKEDWSNCRKNFKDTTGHEVAYELVKLGWVSLFYTPDINNFYDKDLSKFLRSAYEDADKKRIYGTKKMKQVPVEDLVINYKPIIYHNDRSKVKNVTESSELEQKKLDAVMKLPFAFIVAEYGQHVALLIEGSIYGVHWVESPYSDFLYETDSRKFTSEKKENSWNWANGIIVTPRMFWKHLE